ncbi:hypothetical protein EV363DRAFT_1340911, partial [Boletus edulis]
MTRTYSYWVCQLMELRRTKALREGVIPLSNLFDTTRCLQSRIGQTRSMMRRYCRSDQVSTHVSDEILYETSSDNDEGIDPNNITLEDMRQPSSSFPLAGTPTNKRRVHYSRSFAAATTAFRAALKGSPTKLPIGQASESPALVHRLPVGLIMPSVEGCGAATPVQADSRLPSFQNKTMARSGFRGGR